MDQLGIDIRQIIAQVINFVLFFVIFKRFIAVPFSKFIDEEKEKAKETDAALARVKMDEEHLITKQVQLKEEIKRELEKAMKEAKKEAAALKNELIAEAKNDAEEIKKKGKSQVEDEREKLNQSIKERMVDLSIAIVNKAFKNYLDEETKKNITKYILDNLAKDVVYEN